jgi:hypothetical protein
MLMGGGGLASEKGEEVVLGAGAGAGAGAGSGAGAGGGPGKGSGSAEGAGAGGAGAGAGAGLAGGPDGGVEVTVEDEGGAVGPPGPYPIGGIMPPNAPGGAEGA